MLQLMNFKSYELVGSRVHNLLGDNSLKLFKENFLFDMDNFVTDLKADLGCKSVVINDWFWGGAYDDSGYRDNLSTEGSSTSFHRKGMALDLKFVGISLDQAYEYLLKNKYRYPSIKRVESLNATRSNNKYGGWLHIDCKPTGLTDIYVFNP